MPTIELRRWTPKGSQTPVRLYVNGLAGPAPDDKVWIEAVRGRPALKRRGVDGRTAADPALLAQLLQDLSDSGVISGPEAGFAALEELARATPARRTPRAAKGARTGPAAPVPGRRLAQAEALEPATITLAGPVEILLDHREPAQLLEILQEHPMAQVTVAGLPVGDIAINRAPGADAASTDPADYAILVERKDCTRSPTDFEASVIDPDKRFFHQTEHLKLSDALGVLILEGDVYTNSTRMDLVQQIDGALSFATAIQRMSVLPTLSLRHTAYVILKLAQHQRFGLGYDIGLRAEKPKTSRDRSAFVLEGLPGVNASLARALLAHFSSVRAVALAGIEELRAVPGIGARKAGDIHDVLAGETAQTVPDQIRTGT